MISRRQHIDYETCIAFHLGRLSSARAEAVREWLRMYPELQRRSYRDAQAQAQIQHHYSRVLEEPIPPRLLEAGRSSGSRWPARMGVAASIALAAVIGWWMGTNPFLAPHARKPLHVIASVPPHHMRQTATSETHDTPAIPHPNLTRRGYQLVRSKVLRQGEHPLIAFLYRNDLHQQVRIYARPHPTRFRQVPELDSRQSVLSAHWQQHGIDYTLTGNMSPQALQELAQNAMGSGEHSTLHAATSDDQRSAPSVSQPIPLHHQGGTPKAMPAATKPVRNL